MRAAVGGEFSTNNATLFFPHPTEGVVRFYGGIRVCDASTSRPHPVSREQLASGSRPVSRPVSRQSSWPVDPAQYPARATRQWIPPSIPLEQLAVDPAQYPARAACQWIPPSIPPELLASGSRRVSRQSGSPVDPAEYPARAARQWIPPSIPPEDPTIARGSRRVSR